jgi:Flp pilus assembly protein TadB
MQAEEQQRRKEIKQHKAEEKQKRREEYFAQQAAKELVTQSQKKDQDQDQVEDMVERPAVGQNGTSIGWTTIIALFMAALAVLLGVIIYCKDEGHCSKLKQPLRDLFNRK